MINRGKNGGRKKMTEYEFEQNRLRYFKKAAREIKKYNLIFVEEVRCKLGLERSKDTFYRYFPSGSEWHEKIMDLLLVNKINIKSSLRDKWYDSDNASLQISLYKLTGSDEERKRLSQTYIDHTTKEDKIEPLQVIIKGADGENLNI